MPRYRVPLEGLQQCQNMNWPGRGVPWGDTQGPSPLP